jgi:hypothetical protein
MPAAVAPREVHDGIAAGNKPPKTKDPTGLDLKGMISGMPLKEAFARLNALFALISASRFSTPVITNRVANPRTPAIPLSNTSQPGNPTSMPAVPLILGTS